MIKAETKLWCNGWGARIRTQEWRDQNPLPYHLATPQNIKYLYQNMFQNGNYFYQKVYPA